MVDLFFQKYFAVLANGGLGAFVAVALTVAFVAGWALIFIWIFRSAYEKWRLAYIRKHSRKYQCMLQVNNKFHFEDCPNKRVIFNCSSKKKFDNFDYRAHFEEVVEGRFELLKSMLDAAERNSLKLEVYRQELAKLPLSEYRKKRWLDTEDSLCATIKLNPKCSYTLTVEARYTSPQGRNVYSDERSFPSCEILPTYNSIQLRRAEKESRQAQIARERAKVTDSLRYDVFKRDGFRCRICGLGRDDGVVLHVDHIVPVSKGGKSTMDNLRTLCDRCNRGKSDKLEDEWSDDASPLAGESVMTEERKTDGRVNSRS